VYHEPAMRIAALLRRAEGSAGALGTSLLVRPGRAWLSRTLFVERIRIRSRRVRTKLGRNPTAAERETLLRAALGAEELELRPTTEGVAKQVRSFLVSARPTTTNAMNHGSMRNGSKAG
jgi:hypothetical protein